MCPSHLAYAVLGTELRASCRLASKHSTKLNCLGPHFLSENVQGTTAWWSIQQNRNTVKYSKVLQLGTLETRYGL